MNQQDQSSSPTEVAAQALAQAIEAEYGQVEVDYTLTPAEKDRGDFATNFALKGTKALSQSPTDIATKLVARLKQDSTITDAQVAGPGFINITLKPDNWLRWLNSLSAASLQSTLGAEKTTNIEFVSANPTGPLVLVNAWQAYFGDTLARILTSQGYKLEREYFFNDTGGQIAMLGRAVQQAAGASFEAEIAEQLYRGEYVDTLANQLSEDLGGQEQLLARDPYELGREAASRLMEIIKAGLVRMGVQFDRFFHENDLDTKKVIELLEQKDLLKRHDGAVWLSQLATGTDKDEVLVRSEGRGETYFLKDIAYQLDRLAARKYDKAITIVGPDHHGQAIRLSHVLRYLGYDGFVPLSTQTVRLIRDGKEFKMSKRAGNYVLLDDFLDMVPSDVARFYFASRDINSHLDLDLDQLQEQTKNNPLYYCMYAYARASSILAKAKQEGLDIADQIKHELSPIELKLARQSAELPATLAAITTSYKVHTFFTLFVELARSFHDYYEAERIIGLEDAQLRASKLALMAQLQLLFGQLFELIGIVAQEKM